MTSPQTAAEIFERDFLLIRAKLLEIAASLDRIERADAAEVVNKDERRGRIEQAIEILSGGGFDRAERIQLLFSDPYDADWNQ